MLLDNDAGFGTSGLEVAWNSAKIYKQQVAAGHNDIYTVIIHDA